MKFVYFIRISLPRFQNFYTRFSEGVQDFCKCRVFWIGSCDMYCEVRIILVYDIILLYY